MTSQMFSRSSVPVFALKHLFTVIVLFWRDSPSSPASCTLVQFWCNHSRFLLEAPPWKFRPGGASAAPTRRGDTRVPSSDQHHGQLQATDKGETSSKGLETPGPKGKPRTTSSVDAAAHHQLLHSPDSLMLCWTICWCRHSPWRFLSN